MYDSVIVGVVNNPWRKVATLFSVEERIAFVQDATKPLPNVSVEPFSTLLVEFAHARGAMAIVKGLRAISDFEYELEMNQLNRRQAADIESVYLMASAKYSFLRSSGVKELATFGGDISDLVPEQVAAALQERLGR
jgi:pantetheine-phosphate adenylyltransferase